jgi:hypothetical protein
MKHCRKGPRAGGGLAVVSTSFWGKGGGKGRVSVLDAVETLEDGVAGSPAPADSVGLVPAVASAVEGAELPAEREFSAGSSERGD